MNENGRYYNLIYNQIKDMKYFYSWICEAIYRDIPRYKKFYKDIIDSNEFKFSFENAVADAFNNGIEYEDMPEDIYDFIDNPMKDFDKAKQHDEYFNKRIK